MTVEELIERLELMDPELPVLMYDTQMHGVCEIEDVVETTDHILIDAPCR